MKIIFLDFMGTIDVTEPRKEPRVSWKLFKYLKREPYVWNPGPNKECVRWLERLVVETGAKIVYSTTQRYAGADSCIRHVGLHPSFSIGGEFGVTPTLHGNIIQNDMWKPGGVVEYDADGFATVSQFKFVKTRQEEIKAWLEDNEAILEVENFVILDDEIIDHPDLYQHWVSSIPGTGFKEKQYREARRILA